MLNLGCFELGPSNIAAVKYPINGDDTRYNAMAIFSKLELSKKL
tara:strand:+ start:1241 stop:1372 length:132 start_codon:yes stop_codon:yes gene_type:complete